MPDGIEEEDLDAELACLEDELMGEDMDLTSTEATTNEGITTSDAGNNIENDTIWTGMMPSQPTKEVLSPTTTNTPTSAVSTNTTNQQQYNTLV